MYVNLINLQDEKDTGVCHFISGKGSQCMSLYKKKKDPRSVENETAIPIMERNRINHTKNEKIKKVPYLSILYCYCKKIYIHYKINID